MPIIKKALASPKDLQKEIRDELRMSAALRCYSIMRSGNAKSLQMQYETMSNLFHGDEPSIASNIKMLCDGSYIYRDLFDLEESTDAITSKSSQSTVTSQVPKLTLKPNLSRDKSCIYFAGKHILRSDLEKKAEMVSNWCLVVHCWRWQKKEPHTIERRLHLHAKQLILIKCLSLNQVIQLRM